MELDLSHYFNEDIVICMQTIPLNSNPQQKYPMSLQIAMCTFLWDSSSLSLISITLNMKIGPSTF